MVRSSASNSSLDRFQRKACNSTRPPVASSKVATVLRRTKSANRGLRTYHTRTIAAANTATPSAASIHKRVCERRSWVSAVILSWYRRPGSARPRRLRRESVWCCVSPPADARYVTTRPASYPCAAGQAARESWVLLRPEQLPCRHFFANRAVTDSCSTPQFPRAERARWGADGLPRSSSLALRSTGVPLICPE